MWWKQKKEPESPYHGMALGFLVDRYDIQFDGHCTSCDAFQPIYLKELLLTHGKTMIFRDLEPKIPCLFCGKTGVVSVRIIPS
jgi:hypothetical protein